MHGLNLWNMESWHLEVSEHSKLIFKGFSFNFQLAQGCWHIRFRIIWWIFRNLF